MLLEIFIENFILLEKERLNFSNGLNIITGETGSGKSIILNAIKTLLGQNTSKDVIMTGKESAIIEGVFYLESPQAIEFINSNGFFAEDNEIIITREISRKRSSARINGRPCLNGFIKELGYMIMDFHGQNASLVLLDASKQLEIVDDFKTKEINSIKDKVSDKFGKVKEIKDKILEIKNLAKIDPKEMDFLKYQIDEIEKSCLKIGEDSELEDRMELLENSELVRTNLSKSSQILNDNGGIRDNLDTVSKLLSEISHYDSRLKEFNSTLDEIIINSEELYREVKNYLDNYDIDEEELYSVESRLNVINEMKRKYGKTLEEVMEYFEKSKFRYEEAINSTNILDKLNKNLKTLEKEYMMEASKLSDLRKKCAEEFEEKILNEFKDLNMANARMKVEFKKSEIMRRDGIDEVLFTISTNLGEPYKPVNKIASGGEISRIMLGIKTILKNKSGDRFIIYDEIDSGISGKTAEIIGVKMYNVSRNTQIISVTHLPQIAVMADTHIVVEKNHRKWKNIF